MGDGEGEKGEAIVQEMAKEWEEAGLGGAGGGDAVLQ